MRALRALRPFAHRQYRVLVMALAISIFGSGMWAVAHSDPGQRGVT
jgi:hypothetical protein